MFIFMTCLKRCLAGMSFIAFTALVILLISIKLDENVLDQVIAKQIQSRPNSGAFVEELNQWVYNNQGFKKNDQSFLFKDLGPTPVQILESGGDCSDKSRLLSALLKRAGMDSTLVMLYACEGCEPTHTVVEAEYEGGRMVADPVFSLVFPKNNENYYGVKELQKDPLLLDSRLNELRNKYGSNSKIAYYPRLTESYSWPKTINWEKYSALEASATLLKKAGYDPNSITRPRFLEDPKLFLAYITALIGITALCITLVINKFYTR